MGVQINPAEETISVGGLAIRFLVTGEQSHGSVAVFELMVPGGRPLPAPAHSHDHYEETIYGLEGKLTWTVDGKEIEVGAGQAICIPRGAVHRFDNHASEDAKCLCVLSPGAIGPAYFRETSAALNEAARTGVPAREKLMEIMKRYGLTPAPPPAAEK